MKKIYVLTLFVFSVLLLTFAIPTPTVEAQRPLPPNDRAKGLVYDGLNPDAKPGLYKVRLTGKAQGQARFTHGPDPAPANFTVSKTAALATGSVSSATTSASGTVCDGDGTSGKRVQVIYARASNVPDKYATYLASIQQWAGQADAQFNNSAAQTNGSRHIRFVHDANCNPVVPNVALSPTGDDDLGYTVSELWGMGYNRSDRKYLVFMDAHVYCGISDFASDDQMGPNNTSNNGPLFGRIDAGCWSGVIAAHELMHTLGGVQLSAPHSDGNWHCTDGYDNMCDHSGHSINYSVCPNPAGDSLMDCNHDDYFSTNPPANSYLATHWNTAYSKFLISPNSASVNTAATGALKNKVFSPSSTFAARQSVAVRAHVVDQWGANLGSARVSFTVKKPDGSVQCTFTGTTDSTGTATGSCTLPGNAVKGTWKAQVDKVAKTGYAFDTGAPTILTFTVQ